MVFLMESRVVRIMQASSFRNDAEVIRPQACSSIICKAEILGQSCGQKFSFVGILSNLFRPQRHLEGDKHDNYLLKEGALLFSPFSHPHPIANQQPVVVLSHVMPLRETKKRDILSE